MRACILLSWLLVHTLQAQPDASYIFVRDGLGRPLRGTYTSTIAAHQWLGTRRRPAWTVELHFTVSKDHPYSAHEIGTHQSWSLTPDTVHSFGRRRQRFKVINCWCVQKYLLVWRGHETMRIDLPEAGVVDRDVGTVMIRFRPGRYALAEVRVDPEQEERPRSRAPLFHHHHAQ